MYGFGKKMLFFNCLSLLQILLAGQKRKYFDGMVFRFQN